MRQWLWVGSLLLACSSESEESQPGGTPPPLVLDAVELTDTATLAPSHARVDPPDERAPYDPKARSAMLKEGYGELSRGGGEAPVTHAPPGVSPPAASASPTLVVRFAHLADIQLADDESPTRLANFDTPGATAGAYRPQDSHQCHVLNAAVKTLNAVHAKTSLSFVLLGGDNADSAQQNEVDWLMEVLSGADRVECDSGANDDPLRGGHNDGKDPFQAPGLDMPWLWVTGNHDILVQGNVPVTADKDAEAMGAEAVGGTRDWSQPGGPLFAGTVVADPARHLLSRKDLLARVAGNGDGHGLSSDVVDSTKAIYTYDVPDTALRFLILDTAAETGGSNGLLRQGDIDSVVIPLLDKAVQEGKVVALASHHATSSLGDGSGLGGKQQPDAMTEADWLAVLGNYPNVLFSFVGHSHENRVRYLQTGPSTGLWEVMTSALADYPHQMRIVEIREHDQNWYSLHATNVDFSTQGDAVAAEGRRLGVLDWVAGWIPAESVGSPDDRNVELWIQAP